MFCQSITHAMFFQADEQDYISYELEYDQPKEGYIYDVELFLPSKHINGTDDLHMRTKIVFKSSMNYRIVNSVELKLSNILKYPALNIDLFTLVEYDSREAHVNDLRSLDLWEVEHILDNVIPLETCLLMIVKDSCGKKLLFLGLVSKDFLLHSFQCECYDLNLSVGDEFKITSPYFDYIFRDNISKQLTVKENLRHRYSFLSDLLLSKVLCNKKYLLI